MSRIKEQLTDYVQGKIQEIAEYSQHTKVVFSFVWDIPSSMHSTLHRLDHVAKRQSGT